MSSGFPQEAQTLQTEGSPFEVFASMKQNFPTTTATYMFFFTFCSMLFSSILRQKKCQTPSAHTKQLQNASLKNFRDTLPTQSPFFST